VTKVPRMGIALLLVVMALGVGAATSLMWVCAKLAGVETVSLRASVLAACGFGLPLAGAAQVLRSGAGGLAGLTLLLVAVALGLWTIRTAYVTSWGKASLTWFLHLCAWVIVGGLMWQARGS
jgi:hypothetical protein